MRGSILACIALLGGVTAGCQDDLKASVASWNTAAAQWQGKVDGLKADDLEQTQKLNGLCSTEGLAPNNLASKTCAGLDVTAQRSRADLQSLQSAMARNRTRVDLAIARGKRTEVAEAVDLATTELTALVDRVNGDIKRRHEACLTLQTAITEEFEAAKKAALEAQAKAVVWRQAAKRAELVWP